jgi:hypothetical protein
MSEPRRIYQEVVAELQACYDITQADKHRPDKRMIENRAAINKWLIKLDRRNKTEDKGGLVFTLEVCKKILRDPVCADVNAMRERIAIAIVEHRNIDAAHPSSDSSDEENLPRSSDDENGPNPKRICRSLHSTQAQGKMAIEFATSTVMRQLAATDRVTFECASKVLKGGVQRMSDADKHELCTKLGNPFDHPMMNVMVKAAYGVMFGASWGAPIASKFADATVDTMLRSAYPIDGARACYALGIIRRCIVPGATLDTVLDGGPTSAKLGEALDTLHSWRMLFGTDGARRVPTPWIADMCKVAMRMLDDLI